MFLVLVGLSVPALWWTSTRAKELAIGHARRACEQKSLQLLDQTVALKRLRVARSRTGNICLTRDYQFEYTAAGNHRDRGDISMLGHQLQKLNMPFARDAEGNRIFSNED